MQTIHYLYYKGTVRFIDRWINRAKIAIKADLILMVVDQ